MKWYIGCDAEKRLRDAIEKAHAEVGLDKAFDVLASGRIDPIGQVVDAVGDIVSQWLTEAAKFAQSTAYSLVRYNDDGEPNDICVVLKSEWSNLPEHEMRVSIRDALMLGEMDEDELLDAAVALGALSAEAGDLRRAQMRDDDSEP